LGRNFFEFLALKGIEFTLNNRSKRPNQRNENCSRRFVFCSAVRAGNARDPDRKIRAESFARTLGHFARDRFAYRPVSRERFSANAKELPLRRVAVSDHSAEENRRRAGHIREPVCDATAGA
jgi:hypothetical protein